MEHQLCACGHDRRIHNQYGQPCVGCDCAGFTLAKTFHDRKPTMRSMLRRITRRMDMNR